MRFNRWYWRYYLYWRDGHWLDSLLLRRRLKKCGRDLVAAWVNGEQQEVAIQMMWMRCLAFEGNEEIPKREQPMLFTG